MPCSDLTFSGFLYDTGYYDDSTKCFGKCCGMVTALACLLIVILVPSSLETVGSTEMGLAYDVVWADLKSDVMTEGLRVKPTFGTILKWPTEYQEVAFSRAVSGSTAYKASSSSMKSSDKPEKIDSDSISTYEIQYDSKVVCNSKDGIKVEVECTFQFVPDSGKMYDLSMKYKDFATYSSLVRLQARSAIRHACGRATAQDFQTARGQVITWMNDATKEALQTKFFADMKLLQLKNVERPAVYQVAVEAKETARADIDLAQNERAQKLTIAMARLDKAYATANATLNTAYARGNVTVAYAKSQAGALVDKYSAYRTSYAQATIQHGLTPAGTLAYFGTMMLSDKAGSKQTIQLPGFGQIDYKKEQ